MRNLALFFLVLITSCNSDSNLIPKVDTSNDYFFKDGDVEMVFENDKNNGINVIFLGDAYLQEDLGKTYGTYRKHAIENIEALFKTEPFLSYKEHFNAYIVYVKSNTNVIDVTKKNTVFGSTYYVHPTGLSVLTISKYENLNFYVSKATNSNRTEKDLILMSVNNSARGSAGVNSNLAVFGGGDTKVMVHEVGHAFGGLGDEYVIENNDYVSETSYHPNLDNTGDLSSIKWKHFIGLPKYPLIGVFAGGGYVEKGIWRPTHNSIMRGGFDATNFNAPSREAIVKKILELKNIEYNFNKFLEKDVNDDRGNRSINTGTPSGKIACGTILLEKAKKEKFN